MATTLFHEAGGLPAPQQMDERGIPAFPAAERLDGAEKHCSESFVPINLCRMCEIGGIRHTICIFFGFVWHLKPPFGFRVQKERAAVSSLPAEVWNDLLI